MSTKTIGLALALIASGAVYAVQDNPGRDPGERKATTSVMASGDDEISITYQTLHYGEKTLERMKTDEQARTAWKQFSKQLLKGKLTTDVDLKYKAAVNEHTLPAGSYDLGFAMNPDGTWQLNLYTGDRPVGKINLKGIDCPATFDYLNFNLMSAGASAYKLSISYGKMLSVVEFSAAAKGEEGEKKDDGK